MVGATKYQLCKLSSGRFAPCAREITSKIAKNGEILQVCSMRAGDNGTKIAEIAKIVRLLHARGVLILQRLQF